MNHNQLSAMKSHNEYELVHAQKRLRRVIPYNKRHNPVSYYVDDIATSMIPDEMPNKWKKAVAAKTLGAGNCLYNTAWHREQQSGLHTEEPCGAGAVAAHGGLRGSPTCWMSA